MDEDLRDPGPSPAHDLQVGPDAAALDDIPPPPAPVDEQDDVGRSNRAPRQAASSSAGAASRPIMLTREGDRFRLAFAYRKDLVERMRELPFAHFDRERKAWTCVVSRRSVEQLRRMYYDGLTDVAVDDLLDDTETPPQMPDAVVRHGSSKRPFVVHMATRDDRLYSRLTSIGSGRWERGAGGVSYPASSAAALAELVAKGIVADPDNLLRPADVTVTFDARTGRFSVIGDRRAQPMFDRYFPDRDVVAEWAKRGFDVAFSDELSEEIYRGERARANELLQPKRLTRELYPYQQRDTAIIVERSGFAVLHEPGVGKTPIAIAAGCELIDRGHIERVLLVVPASIRTQMQREILKFTDFDPSDVVVIAGTKKKRTEAYTRARDAAWAIVSYDLLHRDLAMVKPVATGSMIVFDEAHRAKNPQAKRAQAARKLAKLASRRLVMTGTPVDESPGEWLSLVGQLAVPGLLGDALEFLNRYQYPGRFGGFEGARNLPELRQRSRYHFARYTKAQVAEHLPPLRVQQVVIDPDPTYAAALKRAHRLAADEIGKGRIEAAKAKGRQLDDDTIKELKAGSEMTAVGMLRAMCSSPRILAQSDSASAEVFKTAGLLIDDDGPKLAELRQLAGDIQVSADRRRVHDGSAEQPAPAVPSDRLVIFTYSRRMADLISVRFKEDGIRHATYTGATSRKDRDVAAARFVDTNDDITALVCTDAAAEGLNLGACCNLLVNFDVPWSPSTLIQRGNRIHRVDGTAERYLVMNFVLSGTMERGVLKLLERKVSVSDAILGESDGKRSTVGQRSSMKATLKAAFELMDRGEEALADDAPVDAELLSVSETDPDDGASGELDSSDAAGADDGDVSEPVGDVDQLPLPARPDTASGAASPHATAAAQRPNASSPANGEAHPTLPGV